MIISQKFNLEERILKKLKQRKYFLLEKDEDKSIQEYESVDQDQDILDLSLLSSLEHKEKLFHIVHISARHGECWVLFPHYMLDEDSVINPTILEVFSDTLAREQLFMFAKSLGPRIILSKIIFTRDLKECPHVFKYEEELSISEFDDSGKLLSQSDLILSKPKSSIQDIKGYQKGFYNYHDYEEKEEKPAASSRHIFIPSSYNSHIYVYDLKNNSIIPVDLYSKTGHIHGFEIFEMQEENLVFSVIHLEHCSLPYNVRRSKLRLSMTNLSYKIELLDSFESDSV